MFNNKKVLITGASTGIGRSIALALAQEGWQVFAGVRNQKDGKSLKNESSGDVVPVILDITKKDQISKAVNHRFLRSGFNPTQPWGFAVGLSD